ncbi:MAG: hypothetical protein EOO88_51845 [Pedobacter sp.]|nr:MAG: hypothetical protein EOO88_51845 [Pedobacter sp.]
MREFKPKVIYIAIDGPRSNNPTDADQVTRSIALTERIDWPCKVERLIRNENMGCKYGVSSAIDWFFSEVEEGIILEDDCLPDISFFSFCAELLARYRNVPAVMHIGGSNLAHGKWWGNDSYLFTKVTHIWGWASWRRAWHQYDLEMKSYPNNRDTLVNQFVIDPSSRQMWKQAFDSTYAGKIDTWDYQWVYSIWLKNGLSVLPSVNLISNIGFDASATHTKFVTEFAELPTGALPILYHPSVVQEHNEATQWLFRYLYRQPSRLSVWFDRVKRKFTKS